MRKTRSSGTTRVHELVERSRALQIDAERLLEYDPGALGESGGPERVDGVAESRRRDREVVQAPRLAAELTICAAPTASTSVARLIGPERAE